MSQRDQPFEEEEFEQASRLVAGRQRFVRKPKKAADVIAQLMARKGYSQTQAAGDLELAWESIVDSQWIKQTKTGNLRRGVLEVIVLNSTVLQQLEFSKQNLLMALQQRLPQNKIKDIRFRIGNLN